MPPTLQYIYAREVVFIGIFVLSMHLSFHVFYNKAKGCDRILHPNVNTKVQKVQNIYFILSITMIALSLLLFGIGAMYANMVESTPIIILMFATYFLYYHVVHLLFGFGTMVYYIRGVKKKLFSIKIYKTIAGILFTPISAIVLYAAILLIALTNCSG